MKVKIFTLYLFLAIFLTDAVEVTDEDVDSPLVSYLLAKVQRLESKMMVKSNIRNARQTTEKPTKPPVVAADNKQCNCPPSIVTYIRWGNTTCPYGANTLYKGVAVGGLHKTATSASNLMCLPPTPMRYSNNQGGSIAVYAVEYRVGGSINHAQYRNMPCALCEATGRGDKIMIPSHYECPNGWHKEYNGYIMAGHHGHTGGSMYNCIDENLEQIKGSGASEDVHLLYLQFATGSYVPTDGGYAMSCVVCTK